MMQAQRNKTSQVWGCYSTKVQNKSTMEKRQLLTFIETTDGIQIPLYI